MAGAVAIPLLARGAAADTASSPAGGVRAGMDLSRLARIDDLMTAAIAKGDCPGGVVLVGRGDCVVWRKAYGHRSIEPDKIPMTVDTVFDMASVTKVVATATSVAVLIDRGVLSLSDRAAEFVPEFKPHGKDRITIEQLLIHRSGLIADNPVSEYAGGRADAIDKIGQLKLIAEPGEKFIYSDVGYIVLGEVVRRVAGMPLSEFATSQVFLPLGMAATRFNPPESWWPRCAPQEKRDGRWIVGEVHDPRAYAMRGVAGHAGLFGTADDLARYCRMILHGGELDGKRVLSPLMVREMVRPRPFGTTTGVRGLGFDIGTGYSSPRGDLFAPFASFGHTGFTGTSFWIDPQTGVYVILLTNRLHPDGKGDVVDLRRKIATVVASAITVEGLTESSALSTGSGRVPHQLWPGTLPYGMDTVARRAAVRNASVLTGLDVLVREGFRLAAGRKVGIITNHTGVSSDGRSIVDLLVRAPNVRVVALFAPEHGFRGVLDERIEHEKDAATGLPIYSLYGETRTPTDAMLEGIDTLVFDIQDVGARFYTYVATMGNCMKAAAKRKIRYVVLDRPNPITGLYVAGPIADEDKLGFTAFWRLPVAHGMTIGELAAMFNSEMQIGAELTVVPMEGWSRDLWFDQTGLLWTNPSPNMRNLTQAMLYPGVCLIEATNVSVGRGTDEPFERFGAPWIDGRKLAAALNASDLAGVRFVPIEFTPAAGSRFGGQKCGGVHVLVTDRDALDSVRVGITIAWQLRALFGDKFDFAKVNNLLANAEALKALQDAKSPSAVPPTWGGDLETFRRIREKYLLYR